ncbi:hypothetical protein O6H91_06G095000 [Diphasiastrum complanatum]|uniref:Uncharacterized protein n=1 Tax=Diphasiastrum complanatum TaxID=34168 RepID=A0ACC2DGS1_DIPCM|nr:hypothetical protein O6H91_06G095000 [Diphasiastrum complanatum]
MQALSRKMKKFPTADKADRTANQEYEVQEFADESDGSTTQRFTRLARDISFFRNSGRKLTLESKVVLPDNQIYQWWIKLVLVWAVYSSFFTPLEFGFFQGLPRHLWLLDLLAQLVFLADIIVTFFVAYKDESTYKMVVDHRSIASRYAKTDLFLDLLGCMPWDMVYKASGKIEGLRFLVWVRLYRVRKVDDFFRKLEKDIRISYFGARIAKLLTVELYCTHTAACIFYYLATTEPVALESDTWIGSITLGGTSYHNFRDIPLATRYITALYWAILTMSTVGYGDIHAVNPKEMVFVMIYVSFDMILGAYLIGNMTALIVKGSNTENFRDKMAMLIKYMNRHSLGKRLRQQMKNHTRLRYESKFMEESIIEDLPVSIRAKVSQALYRSEVEHVPLFKNCSNEFISQLVNQMHEEYFLPGEVIMEQGNAADQIYIVSHGLLEEVLIADDGSEEIISQLEPQSIFGKVAVLSSVPQPYTVRVCELCKLLRLDKQSLDNIMQIYFKDGRQIVTNLLEEQEGDCRMVQFPSDISFVVAKQEIELALRVNAAVFRGDLQQVKSLIKAGAHPTRTDYDGRTPLHLAASRGYEDMVLCLIQEGANVNSIDNFGNTPLMEAVKCGYDNIISLLVERGGLLLLKDPGICLCNAVINGDLGFLKRLLQLEVDPNATDYDHRTSFAHCSC